MKQCTRGEELRAKTLFISLARTLASVTSGRAGFLKIEYNPRKGYCERKKKWKTDEGRALART
jgi:hypothetical protein